MGPIERSINQKVIGTYQPAHFEVENESSKHAVPPGSESHFRVVVVSEDFVGMSRLERSRHLYATLKEELQQGVHALSQRCFTIEEWQSFASQLNLNSPACLGKNEKR